MVKLKSNFFIDIRINRLVGIFYLELDFYAEYRLGPTRDIWCHEGIIHFLFYHFVYINFLSKSAQSITVIVFLMDEILVSLKFKHKGF